MGIVQGLTVPMSGDEKVLDDFPKRNCITTAEYLVGAYREESPNEWTAAIGITSKIPPSSDGATSWFKCEEPIEN